MKNPVKIEDDIKKIVVEKNNDNTYNIKWYYDAIDNKLNVVENIELDFENFIICKSKVESIGNKMNIKIVGEKYVK